MQMTRDKLRNSQQWQGTKVRNEGQKGQIIGKKESRGTNDKQKKDRYEID